MNDVEQRAALIAELARRTVVLDPPDTHIDVRATAFLSDDGSPLEAAIYSASGDPSQPPPPVVVIATGYPDPDGRMRRFGPLTSWARLLAASGVASVIYANRSPARDLRAVLAHVRTHGEVLGVDGSRLALFSSSGHVPVALSALLDDRQLTCAALLYGYTMDADGESAVASAAGQAGFVAACAGRSVAELPASVPLLVVRAGQDQMPGLNDALDRFIRDALAANLSVSLRNHPSGAHAFDIYEDTDASRALIRHVVAFLVEHLNP